MRIRICKLHVQCCKMRLFETTPEAYFGRILGAHLTSASVAEASKKTARKRFIFGAIKSALTKLDRDFAETYDELY